MSSTLQNSFWAKQFQGLLSCVETLGCYLACAVCKPTEQRTWPVPKHKVLSSCLDSPFSSHSKKWLWYEGPPMLYALVENLVLRTQWFWTNILTALGDQCFFTWQHYWVGKILLAGFFGFCKSQLAHQFPWTATQPYCKLIPLRLGSYIIACTTDTVAWMFSALECGKHSKT